MEKSLVIFEKFLRSEATKEKYLYYNTFLKWAQKNVEKLATADGLLQLSRFNKNFFLPIFTLFKGL
jgi:hypothetical protein